ncbi:CagC family type IV secretion system protein (plasmid) [Aerococcus urinaeequi]|uniref:CagC family type IV secretion system protein n=1 Tax=Aerococcus urinaeequi TaxID=51665 RepID=A0AAE9XK08_9LACT|nr:CagC family type IV secretion system protein [Aerococcus urinaeequi]WCG38787.1 CagC family type IV secretion system protein [Aerococcus urinaeequi]
MKKKLQNLYIAGTTLASALALDNPVYASDVEGRVIRGLAPVQSLLTGILVTVGIVVGLFIIIKRMPSADDPQEKNEVYKSVGRVLGLVALGAAIVWIVPWVYGLFQ